MADLPANLDELTEIRARALCEFVGLAWDLVPSEGEYGLTHRFLRDAARAIAEADEAAGVVSVPMPATQEMANQGWAAIARNSDDPQGAAWPIFHSMVIASPYRPKPKEAEHG